MKNILIADDNDEIREIVRILLESEGFNISEAMNGEDAVNKVNDDTDLIILDIMMPRKIKCSYFISYRQVPRFR